MLDHSGSTGAGARAPAVDGDALTRFLHEIVALGNRFPGTAGEARTRAWLLDELRRLDLDDVHEEPFPYLGYEPVSARCELVGEGLVTPCVGLQCTSDGAVEAQAVYLGRGTDDDVAAVERAGVDLRAKVAVVHGGLVNVVAPRLVGRGAAAIVNIGETQDGHVGHFTASFYPPPTGAPWTGRVLLVPGVTVEADAGLRLLSLLAAGRDRVRVEHRARYAEQETANVVARIPGDDPAGEEVIVGAHYDTQLDGVGASDNATGLASLLEIARGLRRRRLRRTVVVVAFAAEELGSWGAYAYVLRNAAAGHRIVAMINLDALGAPLDATRTIVADPAIAAFAAESAQRTGWDVEVELEASAFPYADHIPFVDAGIPACWIWRYPPQHPYYHSAGDVLRYVDVTHLMEDAAAAACVVSRLAQEDVELGPARPARTWARIPSAPAALEM